MAAPATFDELLERSESAARPIAARLRELVFVALPHAAEEFSGAEKVSLALYRQGKGGPVVCGIQPAGERCHFYLHRIERTDSAVFRSEGNGKHALRTSFADTSFDAQEVKRLVSLSLLRLDDRPLATTNL
jgi:hypothetical protein